MPLIPAAVCCAALLWAAGAGAVVLVEDGRPVSVVVIGEDADPAVRFAAGEIIGHVRLMTGAELPLRESGYSDIPVTVNAVLVGPGDWMDESRFADSAGELAVLGEQGVVIRDYPDGEPGVLLVTGDGPRGVVYAACELLRSVFNVRWFAPGVTDVPGMRTLDTGSVAIGDIPCFDVRDVVVPGTYADSLWNTRLRVSAGYGFMERELGCRPVFQPAATGVDDLIPDGLFEENPELFPLVDGERLSDRGRCLGNPESVIEAARSMENFLDASPNVTCITLDPPENAYICECFHCREIRGYENRPGGVFLTWLNEVAAMVGRRHPEVVFEYPAIGGMEEPPSTVRPADNVLVRLEPDGVDLLHPVEGSVDERTMAFREHLRAWRLTGARISIVHPCAHFEHPPYSFPDIGQVMESVSLYHYEFAENCRFRLCGECPPGLYVADAELKMWLLSELMWDRYRDGAVLVREWMKGMYGYAWGPMFDYHRHVQSLEPDTPLAGLVDEEWLRTGARMFQRARAQSLTDRDVRRRVERARSGFRYMEMVWTLEEIERGRKLEKNERRKLAEEARNWLETCEEQGFTHISVSESCEMFVSRFADAVLE